MVVDHGLIVVHSKEGEGACFAIRLPVAPVGEGCLTPT